MISSFLVGTRRFLTWLKTAWFDLLFLGLLLWLLWKIRGLVMETPSNLTAWLLVYLTAIYALLTLYLACVSLKSAMAAERSAMAAERSAKAMEDSIQEARMTRWAQFGASIQLADDRGCIENSDGSITLDLLNPFEQPVINLQAAMWQTEIGSSGEREIRYSSMLQSQPRSVLAGEKKVSIVLHDLSAPESDKRNIGEMALERFKQVFNSLPQYRLCLITYNDRVALLSPMVLVFDLNPQAASSEEAKRLNAAIADIWDSIEELGKLLLVNLGILHSRLLPVFAAELDIADNLGRGSKDRQTIFCSQVADYSEVNLGNEIHKALLRQ